MDATTVMENINRVHHLMSPIAFTADSLRALLHNSKKVLIRRHVQNVEGFGTPDEWEQLMLDRINTNDSIFRILFLVLRHLISNEINLLDVGCADPDFLADCMQNGSMLPYYAVYPQTT